MMYNNMNQQPTIQEIQAATRLLLNAYGFMGAVLFGSYADGTASAISDIDLFLQVPQQTKTKKIFEFAYDLGEELGVNVDAYGSHEVPVGSKLYDQIQMKGIAL